MHVTGRIRTADLHLSEVTGTFTTGFCPRRRASIGPPADRLDTGLGNSEIGLHSCSNANSSFEESKPASHPFFGNGFHGTCRSRRESNPLASRSKYPISSPPAFAARAASAGKPADLKASTFPGERSSRTLILREDASCPVRLGIGRDKRSIRTLHHQPSLRSC